ncbi:zinc transporter ZntB [Ferrimonas balearica]|uniref:zinc transporter ZntB n=1 Tax=Ferrimonas balearica TaxID=44012 RepID=UPI001C99E72B|nr:zinc transporter ZntB [Ferrimonas balearica]MBY5992539.1 zinc transporter ZntB [Ferrimonas balearica]
MADSAPLQGLLHALLLDGQGGARPLSWPEVAAWSPQQGFLWLHLDYSEPQAQAWLREHSGLSALVAEALLAEDTRPRTSPMEAGLLMALRGVNQNPQSDPEDMVSLRLFLTPERLITTRRRKLLSVANLIEGLNTGSGPHGAMDTLASLVDGLIWGMGDVVAEFEERIDALESELVAPDGEVKRLELTGLRQQCIALRRHMAPQREALIRLAELPLTWLEERHRLHLREGIDRLARHIEGIDAIRERAALVQEELLGRASEQLNGRMYVLSVIAAIFLPLGFFTGLLGVNVAGIPGESEPLAFWWFLVALVAVVVGQLLLFRWKRWL